MTESPLSPSVVRVPSDGAVARRRIRCLPATAAGLLTALALGATSVLVTGDAAHPDGLVAVAALPAAAGPALMHPVRPPEAAATPAAPQAPAARDPFRPLLTPPAAPVGGGAQPPAPSAPVTGTPGTGVPQGFPPPAQPGLPYVPEPVGQEPSVTGSTLQLTKVEAAGDSYVAVLTVGAETARAAVGDSFGPGGQLLLLSLQQGPADGQWTAVVQVGSGEPFDLVSGVPTRLP